MMWRYFKRATVCNLPFQFNLSLIAFFVEFVAYQRMFWSQDVHRLRRGLRSLFGARRGLYSSAPRGTRPDDRRGGGGGGGGSRMAGPSVDAGFGVNERQSDAGKDPLSCPQRSLSISSW